jgi:gluconate 5-dehydrogenase
MVTVAGFDVTLAQAAREGVEAIERDSGAIDILVNNAGMQFRSPLEDIASVRSERARPGIGPHTATKGATTNLTRGMCADWTEYGLQINAIAPGCFKTSLNQALVDNPEFSSWLEKRTPAARWGHVEELVGAMFLSGKASSFGNRHWRDHHQC